MKEKLVEIMTKAGARHGRHDRECVQCAHDAIASLVDSAHCMKDKAASDATLEKVGARHSRSDLKRIEDAHRLMVELGAGCAPMGTDEANINPVPLGQKPTTPKA